MPDLEARLRRLGPVAFPPTPELAGAVGARLRAGEPIAQTRRLRAPRGLVIALAALALPAAAVAAVPDTRHAVLDWLGLRHVRVERVEHLPHLPGLQRADLGTRVDSVHEASHRAGFAVQVPGALGAPGAVYVAGDLVSLVYDDVVVTEARARRVPDLLKKVIGPATTVERVSVRGAPGVFISGPPHEVLYLPPDGGGVRPIPSRLAGNTLAFEPRGLVVHIEGRIGKARALTIARSLEAP